MVRSQVRVDDRRRPRLARAVLQRAVFAACLLGTVVAADAAAATGDLTQKPGTAGCVSETGAGPCADGTALVSAFSVTVSPDGSSAYAASTTSGAVAVFDRAADGTLTQKSGTAGCISDTGAGPCVDGTALDAAASVAVSPDGRSAYVASFFSDAVAVFDRAADGTLTQKPGTAGCISDTGAGPCVDGTALDGARSVTVSPDGSSAYVASGSSDAVAVFDRAADGTLSQKSGTAGCISDTGAGPCADGTALAGAGSVALSPDGASAYVTSFNSGAVAVFDRAADGTLSQKSGLAGCVSESGAGSCVDGTALANPSSVALSPDGASAYVTSFFSDAVALFDRAADGTLSQKPGTAGCISDTGAGPCVDGTALDGASSVAVSSDGRSAYVASGDSDAVAVFDREPLPPPPPPTPPSGPAPPSPALPDTTRPLLSALSLSPSRFRAAARGPSIAARIGSTVSYRLSEPAAVRFRVERALPGRRVGGRCVKPTRSNRRAQRCTRYRTLRGGFTHRGKAGRNKFKFSGRLRGRKLRPARYRLRAVATDPAGNRSRPQRSRFRILRR
jgi:DNA-binding beta-propeller fold protein YncE